MTCFEGRLFDMSSRTVSILVRGTFPNVREIKLLTCVTELSQEPQKVRERKVGGKGGVENIWFPCFVVSSSHSRMVSVGKDSVKNRQLPNTSRSFSVRDEDLSPSRSMFSL